jgi:cytoskeleton protein RodZ
LRRGEDIRSIAQSLRIRRDQLEALEESRYDALPARAYAIGFVRSYAEYLGLDSRHIVDRYKAELDRNEAGAADIHFPDGPHEERRLPRGTALIVALVVASGAYGGWLLTKSTDEMIASRVAGTAPEAAPEVTAAIPPSLRAGRGDSASAATPREGMVPSARGAAPADTGMQVGAEAVYEAAPAIAPAIEQAIAPAADAAAEAAREEQAAELPPLPEGTPYGAENVDGRVVVRARRDGAWIRVEDGEGRVLIEQTFNAGDSYRAPRVPGVILVARDASAFELMVDGTSLGLAGPPTLVLTGKSLDPEALLAAAPRPALPEDGAEASAEPVEQGQTAIQ